jgi:hypothetical protein
MVSQFLEAPKRHWDAAICIIWYLKKTPSHGMLCRKNRHLRVEGSLVEIGQDHL